MPYFAVSYQLNFQRNYQTLWDEMARLRGHKVMRSLYFVDMEHAEPACVKKHLRTHVDADDRIAVMRLDTRPACFSGCKATADWLDARFSPRSAGTEPA